MALGRAPGRAAERGSVLRRRRLCFRLPHLSIAMEPNSPKKIQFAVPLFQSQIDPEAAEQVSRQVSLTVLRERGRMGARCRVVTGHTYGLNAFPTYISLTTDQMFWKSQHCLDTRKKRVGYILQPE